MPAYPLANAYRGCRLDGVAVNVLSAGWWRERQLTKKYMLENAIVEGALLSRAEIAKGLAAIADAVTSRIMAADVSRSVKEDLLNDLAGLPMVLENVALAQTRLPRGNGTRPEEDQSES